MARKTIKIADLIEHVNEKNQISTCSAEMRKGWNFLLADILHKNGVYAGYNYYKQCEVPSGHKPGIIHSKDIETEPHVFPDETRRFYCISAKLQK